MSMGMNSSGPLAEKRLTFRVFANLLQFQAQLRHSLTVAHESLAMRDQENFRHIVLYRQRALG